MVSIDTCLPANHSDDDEHLDLRARAKMCASPTWSRSSPPFLCAHKKQIGQTYTVGPGLRVGLKKGASRDACRPASSSSMTMSCSFSSLLMISGW